MTTLESATDTRSGKGHRDENFPVASHLIHPRHRGAILAFYNYVRAGDDVADHADLSPERKIVLLDGLADALTGAGPSDPEAAPLKAELATRRLPPRHALELLDAFRMDARKNRYADWDELIHYCRYSAMPVGRFVLDVHGEDPARVYGPSDKICAALQIINHLQDCGKDFRNLDRVYLPQDCLDRHGATIAMLGQDKAPPALRAVFRELAEKCLVLLDEGATLPDLIETRDGGTLTLRWKVPGDGPFPLPVEVEVDGVVQTLPMADGSGSIALPTDAHVVVDPMARLLRRSIAVERMQAPIARPRVATS